MKILKIVPFVLLGIFSSSSLSYNQNIVEQNYFRGLEYGAQGKIEEAKGQFEKARNIDQFSEVAKESLKVIEDVMDQKIKLKTAIHLFKGLSSCEQGKWDDSVTEFNMAIKLNSTYAYTYTCRCGSYFIKGNYGNAISDCNKAIEINPRDAMAFNNRGLVYAHKGQYDRAIFDFNKAIELNPKLAVAHYNRGNAYDEKGQYDEAISDCNKAIELNPRFVLAYQNRGSTYITKGKYDKAIADFNKAIKINPTLAKAYHNRGIAYFFKGEYNKAWKDVKMAQALGYQINPKFLKALRKASGRER